MTSIPRGTMWWCCHGKISWQGPFKSQSMCRSESTEFHQLLISARFLPHLSSFCLAPKKTCVSGTTGSKYWLHAPGEISGRRDTLVNHPILHMIWKSFYEGRHQLFLKDKWLKFNDAVTFTLFTKFTLQIHKRVCFVFFFLCVCL